MNDTSATPVILRNWSNGLPDGAFRGLLTRELPGEASCQRESLGKMRLLSKSWKAMVDTNLSELSCRAWNPMADEDPMPCAPSGIVCSLIRSASPAFLTRLCISSTPVTNNLLEAVLSRTSLTSLALSGHGPKLRPTTRVLEKFGQLVNLKSISIFGSLRHEPGVFIKIRWWFQGRLLAVALEGIPGLTDANLLAAQPNEFRGRSMFCPLNRFIQTLPSASLTHLLVTSLENVVRMDTLAALEPFKSLTRLDVRWHDGAISVGHQHGGTNVGWSLDMLRQLRPLEQLRELSITWCNEVHQSVARQTLPNITSWGLTRFQDGYILESSSDDSHGDNGNDMDDFDDYDSDDTSDFSDTDSSDDDDLDDTNLPLLSQISLYDNLVT